MRLTQPVFCDPYSGNRMTGGLILIDESTNSTVAAALAPSTSLACCS
jgi:sulfate adenylyltransferase subunit 1 (EFTu-like GTPase family)